MSKLSRLGVKLNYEQPGFGATTASEAWSLAQKSSGLDEPEFRAQVEASASVIRGNGVTVTPALYVRLAQDVARTLRDAKAHAAFHRMIGMKP
jgi:hypothetical protein